MPDLIAGGVRVHYAASALAPRDPTLVFLHGAGANHSIWLGQMRALRGRARVLLPDLPGHGHSQEIPGHTIEEYASVLAAFLEAIAPAPAGGDSAAATSASAVPDESPTDRGDRSGAETHPGPREAATHPEARGAAIHRVSRARTSQACSRRVVLAGHSMGGAIALTLALDRPDLLSGLVLIGSGAKLGVAREILEGLENAPQETQALIARWSFSPGADPALILRTMRELSGVKPGRTLADFRACNAFDVRGRIDSITLPTLILSGGEDRMTPPRYASYMVEHIPGATLRILDGMGHGMMIEATDTVSTEIARFLDALPAARDRALDDTRDRTIP